MGPSDVTSHNKQIPAINGLRAFAILYVVALHLYGYFKAQKVFVLGKDGTPFSILEAVLLNGGFGVSMFFVISGFLIFRSLQNKYAEATSRKAVLKNYFKRRFTRIEPPYLIALIINFILLLIKIPSSMVDAFQEQWPHLLTSLLYCHNIVFPARLDSLNMGVWSLEVEIQFYLLAPLLLLPLMRIAPVKRNILLATFWLLALVCNLIWQPPFQSVYQWLPYFLSGVFLSSLRPQPIAQRRNWFLFLAGVLLLCLILFRLPLMETRVPTAFHRLVNRGLYPIITALFFAVVFRSASLNYLFTRRPLPFIGYICYSIYLMHYPIIAFTGSFVRGMHISDHYWLSFFLQALFIGPFTLLGCTLFYRMFEKPFLQNSILDRKTGPYTGVHR